MNTKPNGTFLTPWFPLCILLLLGGWMLLSLRTASHKIDQVTETLARLDQSMARSGSATSAEIGSIKATLTELRQLAETEVASVDSDIKPLQLNHLGDIPPRLDPLVEKGSIEEFATGLGEVDSWIFPPDEEPAAFAKIDEYVGKLSDRIFAKILELDDQALKAASGAEAAELLGQSSTLMTLSPAPKDEEAMQRFKEAQKRREEISRRVNDLRGLRYNHWAVTQIEKGFAGYHENKSKLEPFDEDDKLVASAVNALAPINPGLLDVSTMKLYLALLELTNDALDEAHKISLAKQLNDPTVTRKSSDDF